MRKDQSLASVLMSESNSISGYVQLLAQVRSIPLPDVHSASVVARAVGTVN